MGIDDIVKLLCDPENQPHQYMGDEKELLWALGNRPEILWLKHQVKIYEQALNLISGYRGVPIISRADLCNLADSALKEIHSGFLVEQEDDMNRPDQEQEV
jgi:hypothetical protein